MNLGIGLIFVFVGLTHPLPPLPQPASNDDAVKVQIVEAVPGGIIDADGTVSDEDVKNEDLKIVKATKDEDSTKVLERSYRGIKSDYDYRQWTVERIESETERISRMMQTTYDQVSWVPKDKVNFDNTLKPLIDLDGDIHWQSGVITFAKNVADSKELRDASTDAGKKLDNLSTDLSARKDVFEVVKAFAETEEANMLDHEKKRYLEQFLRDGKRGGLELTDEKLEEFKTLKKKVNDIGIDFRKCLSEDLSHFYADESELEGVPQDVIESMDVNDEGQRKVTTKYPHYKPVIAYAKNPKTRLTMETVYQKRCVEENTPRIEELVKLRHQKAKLLGYPTHAAYRTETRMAKNPETVKNFLRELKEKLQKLWSKEKIKYLELKKAESEEMGIEFDGKINKEDFWYYVTQVEKLDYQVDSEKLKEYFPIETVINGMLDIYQTLLGLKFTKQENAEVWHEEVSLHKVSDAESGETLGYFFMDLHPRDGKYGHAAMWGLQPGSLDRHGRRQKAVAAMVCNFPRPSATTPALLEHKQVKTLFHEFGHVMHGIVSRTNISSFFGTNVERDFVEAPSQMLENWVWQPETLKLMSGHYKDNSPIPSDLLEALANSKQANEGGKSLRQIFFGTYDITIHTSPEVDSLPLARDIYLDVLGVERINGTNIGANLGHLIGYDAGYYGYMWSLVFATDMFQSRFKKEGILNPQTGMDYRNMILRPGGSYDANEMLNNFLGREPNQEAFLKDKGIDLF